ncbi:hypothetical protein BS78_01G256800 [Paspalum vaginatum]|nr:hypothetical protein BS78_01G256800 [Paspalum vaginatum]
MRRRRWKQMLAASAAVTCLAACTALARTRVQPRLGGLPLPHAAPTLRHRGAVEVQLSELSRACSDVKGINPFLHGHAKQAHTRYSIECQAQLSVRCRGKCRRQAKTTTVRMMCYHLCMKEFSKSP